MKNNLGICVASPDNFNHVLGITETAKKLGKNVEVFITGEGVRITEEPQFSDLLDSSQVSICEVSYFTYGYKGVDIPGLTDKDFVTQGKNAEIVDNSERYLIL